VLENNIIYIPPDVIQERFLFFAVDNVDFAEDTRIIFDGYNVPHSLKQATRSRRQGTQSPVVHRVRDTTNSQRVNEEAAVTLTDTASWQVISDKKYWSMHYQRGAELLLHEELNAVQPSLIRTI